MIEGIEGHLDVFAPGGFAINGVEVIQSINQKQDSLKFAIGFAENVPPSDAYMHSAGGYRINFGVWTQFKNIPSKYNQILAIIPLGIYSSNDKSYVGALSFTSVLSSNIGNSYDNVELWGVGASNSMHLAQILIIYT